MFNISSFNRLLQTGWLGRRFWYFQTLESTNRYLQDLPANRLSQGLICLTDNQTVGKGQFGRKWLSDANDNLTFTIVLKPARNFGLQLISLAVMYALKKSLDSMFPMDCQVKWPNDLLISGKKAAGLLTECRYNGKKLDRVYLGLGLNVNQSRFPEEISEHATSVIHHTGGQPVDRALLLAVFLNTLEPVLGQAEDGDRDLIRNINRSIQGYGQWVSLSVDGIREETPVKILGVNEFGFLMVLTANDEVKIFTHEQIRIDVSAS